MEETMYWCPCQLAMKNNAIYWSADGLEYKCNVIGYHLVIDPSRYTSYGYNYALDTAIHNVCKEHCEYYKALLEMSEGAWIN